MAVARAIFYPIFGVFVALVWFPATLVLTMLWQVILFGIGPALLLLPVSALWGGPAWLAGNLAACFVLYASNRALQPRLRIEAPPPRR